MNVKSVPASRLKPVGQLLELRLVPLANVQYWERNPKLHDIPALVASLQRNGFQYPPKFDATLNDGKGGIVFGNGRIEALAYMKAAGLPVPDGITLNAETGDWAVPILFGNDLVSQKVAEAFAVDHNNLVMAGGDFTSMFATQMWDETRYVTLLNDLGLGDEITLPVTVTPLELEVLNEVILEEAKPRQRPDKGKKLRFGMYRCYIPTPAYEAWEGSFLADLGDGVEKEAIIAELKRRLQIKPVEELAAEEVDDDNADQD